VHSEKELGLAAGVRVRYGSYWVDLGVGEEWSIIFLIELYLYFIQINLFIVLMPLKRSFLKIVFFQVKY
jgi:hypothetical protein